MTDTRTTLCVNMSYHLTIDLDDAAAEIVKRNAERCDLTPEDMVKTAMTAYSRTRETLATIVRGGIIELDHRMRRPTKENEITPECLD